MPRNLQDPPEALDTTHTAWIVIAFVVATLVAVAGVSRYALLTAVQDGLRAATAILPAAFIGFWIVRHLPFTHVPRRWHILVGAGLGLGLTSVLVLLLGLLGILAYTAAMTLLWKGLLLLCVAATLLWLRTLLNRPPEYRPCGSPSEGRGDAHSKWGYLWLIACPFMVLAVLAAVIPPGFIWAEEGFGYDILEYHLQMPKEYFQAGHIGYAAHNVYANFPANVEMLYLLAMLVNANAYEIGTIANLIHLLFAVLTVYATWVIGRDWSWRSGLVAGLSMATAGWLVYLSGLAYVENGMLLFGMIATGAVLRAGRCGVGEVRAEEQGTRSVIHRERRWLALAGAFAGLACGCKYTAVPLVALPLLVCSAALPVRRPGRRLGDFSIFLGMTFLTFSPWLVKNQVLTGNPVFPLANSLFKASPPGWGTAQTEQWDRGHILGPNERTASARLGALWRHIPGDSYQRLGPSVMLLAVVGLFARRRDRTDGLLVIMLLIQLGVWTFATHLYARFAVPMLIPLALLAGRAALCQRNATAASEQTRFRLIAVVLVGGAVWNFAFAARLFARESPGDAPDSLFYAGDVPGFEYLGVVNYELEPNAKVLLVGETRAFYFQQEVDYCVAFNRNPFLAALDKPTTEAAVRYAMGYLRSRGYTHVLVHWGEVRRLSTTYGFSPPVTEGQLVELFFGLTSAGLERVRTFAHPHSAAGGRFVDLYRIVDK